MKRDTLAIGPSSVHWTGEVLEIAIEERDKRLGIPWQRPVRGVIRVIPEALNPVGFALDPGAKHHWHCLAPRARIEVEMHEPALSWTGRAYLDSNFGSESLEDGFDVWHWSRAHLKKGAVVSYEGQRGDGSRFASAIRFEDPRLPMMMAAPGRLKDAPKEMRQFVYAKPVVGDVLLWESWLRHEVPMNMAEEDRISVSFNYAWG